MEERRREGIGAGREEQEEEQGRVRVADKQEDHGKVQERENELSRRVWRGERPFLPGSNHPEKSDVDFSCGGGSQRCWHNLQVIASMQYPSFGTRVQVYPPLPEPHSQPPLVSNLPPSNGSARPMQMPTHHGGSAYMAGERRSNTSLPPSGFTPGARQQQMPYMMVNNLHSHPPALAPRHPSSTVSSLSAPERGLLPNSYPRPKTSSSSDWPQTPRDDGLHLVQPPKTSAIANELATLSLEVPDDQWYEPGMEGLPIVSSSALSPRNQHDKSGGLTAAARKAQQRAYKELAKLATLVNEEDPPSICGVGISFVQESGRIFIKSIQEGSAAAETAMLEVGDQLCLIDHTSIEGLSVMAAEDKLYGEENSVVILSVLKEGEDRLTHATLVRSSGQRERNERKRKEIYDVGIAFALAANGQVVITELAAGGPADKLGFIHVGDAILAIDEEPLPQGENVDIAGFVTARMCGPKGSPVVLTLVKPSVGMKQHVQLRRNHLYGATDVRARSERSELSKGGACRSPSCC
eukprot:767969-Hanusia_phi.AAC.1